jgi:hypothetical protein
MGRRPLPWPLGPGELVCLPSCPLDSGIVCNGAATRSQSDRDPCGTGLSAFSAEIGQGTVGRRSANLMQGNLKHG